MAFALKNSVKNIIYLFILSLSVLVIQACSEDDDFSSDKSLSLSFSANKISFDTIFTTIGSATKQFKIYNKNNKSLVIESIELMNAGTSGFRINIDGEKGTKLNNVEILKKDSLFGFIEVTINPSDSSSPVVIKDSIKFITNGNIQYLLLEAIGQDVYIWKNKVISKDTTLTNQKPFLIYDSLTVKKNITLTIGEGTKFFMKNNTRLYIHGKLLANGTVDNPILFRGDRLDKIEGDIPYDNVPGQWNGIYFYPESYDNFLNNVHIRNAIRGMTFYASNQDIKKAALTNVMVHKTTDYGILTTNSNIEAKNCLFTNSKGAALKIIGGKYSLIHCTIANYFRWSTRQSEALVLSNISDIGKPTPLEECNIINSIIYGSSSNEISLEVDASNAFNYQFINCLIKAPESNQLNTSNSIFNKNPLFKDLNYNYIYSYNFELQRESPAINMASKEYSFLIPYDLKGRSRLLDSNPDIGCYEWVE